MGDDQVPQQYWNTLLAMATRAQAESKSLGVDEAAGIKDSPEPETQPHEKRAWLENVMRDLVLSTDPSKMLEGVMEGLFRFIIEKDFSNVGQETALKLAHELDSLLQYADLTEKFNRLGGLEIITRFLDYESYEELQKAGARWLTTLCDNNPIAQEIIIQHKLFTRVLELLEDSSNSMKFRYKLLGSLSCIVRSYGPALELVLCLKGHQRVAGIARENCEEKLAQKAVRVLASIVYSFKDEEIRASSLHEVLCEGYTRLALRREEDSCEMEYIRDVILCEIKPESLSEETKSALREALSQEKQKEFEYENQRREVERMYQKFSG